MKRNTRRTHAIIIGDSTNNTLSIVRSLGEAKIDQTLILKCESDVCHVGKSRYLKRGHVFRIEAFPECLSVLEELKDRIPGRPILMCSFDEAAVFIDNMSRSCPHTSAHRQGENKLGNGSTKTNNADWPTNAACCLRLSLTSTGTTV